MVVENHASRKKTLVVHLDGTGESTDWGEVNDRVTVSG